MKAKHETADRKLLQRDIPEQNNQRVAGFSAYQFKASDHQNLDITD